MFINGVSLIKNLVKYSYKLLRWDAGDMINTADKNNDTTKFEDDYLTRTYSNITSRPDIAITELVANAWDSGAENVTIKIKIAEYGNSEIIVEDDGTGMTDEQFQKRWMTLAYNRMRHQGEWADMPPERSGEKRRVYGGNGVGRHGMLCFSNQYIIETWRDGVANYYELVQSGGNTALKIVDHKQQKKDGHGTILSAKLERNIPNEEEIYKVLSARFMFDPQFRVFVNGKNVNLEDYPDKIKEQEIVLLDDLKIKITAIKSGKTAKTSLQHGVAFWVNKRLVGEPSWQCGKFNLADGRTTMAKQYTIIVESDDLLNDIKEDWTELRDTERVAKVYEKIKDFTNDLFKSESQTKHKQLRQDVIKSHYAEIEKLGYVGKRNTLSLIDKMLDRMPDISKDELDIIVEQFISITGSTNKMELFRKINDLQEGDADKLNNILEEWDVNDMEEVLDEIDKRIAVIEAIERFGQVEGMDELHVLHPLVLEAKWLFGPQYDSAFFTSNKTLTTILRDTLKKPEAVENITIPYKRPDILVFDDGSMIGYATEDYNTTINLSEYRQLLLLELKCGGKEIGVSEMNQAEQYMSELYYSGALGDNVEIHAFVVGDKIGGRMPHQKELIEGNNKWGTLVATTYGQLVQTSKIRLFGLKDKLAERYSEMDEGDLLSKVLKNDERQITMQDYIKKKMD